MADVELKLYIFHVELKSDNFYRQLAISLNLRWLLVARLSSTAGEVAEKTMMLMMLMIVMIMTT